MGWLKLPGVHITLALLVYAVLAWWGGAFVAIITVPGLAAALARPILALLSDFRHAVRHHIWKEAQGRYYKYKDVPIQVMEDTEHCRWVNMGDVRKVLGATASDRALAHTYPNGWHREGKTFYLRDDALVAHLCKENRPLHLRMGHWVQRSIAYPGERIRKDLGIRVAPAGAPRRRGLSRAAYLPPSPIERVMTSFMISLVPP